MKETLTRSEIEIYFKILDNKEYYQTIEKLALELLKVNNGVLDKREGALRIIFNPYRSNFFERKGDIGLEHYFDLEPDWGEVDNIRQWEVYLKYFVDAFKMLLEADHFINAN